MHRLGWLLLVVLAGGSLGCQKIKERMAEKAAEKAVEAATGAQVDLQSGQGTVTLTGDNGAITVVNGAGAKVPDGWPKDVPLYAKGTLKNSVGVRGDDKKMHYTLTYEVADPAASVVAFYREGLAGYQQVSALTLNKSAIVSFEGNGQVVAVTVSPIDGQEKSMLTLIVTSKSGT